MARLRVRLLSDRAGLTEAGRTFRQEAGDVVPLPREEALALIRAGSAERVDDEPERATANPYQQSPRKKRGRSKQR